MNAEATDGANLLPLDAPNVTGVIVYLERNLAPTHSQVALELATGALHRLELTAMTFRSVAV